MTTTTEPATTTEALPTFDGCYEGTVTFSNATCMDELISVNLTNAYGNDTATFMIQVVGCCDTGSCRATDGVTRSNTCIYGSGTSNSVEVSCNTYCFAYVSIDSNDNESVERGCLSDLDLSDTGFSSISTCSDTIKDGSCVDANSEEECLRCCTGAKCNEDFVSKSGILDDGESGTDAASAIVPSLLLMLFSLLVTRN